MDETEAPPRVVDIVELRPPGRLGLADEPVRLKGRPSEIDARGLGATGGRVALCEPFELVGDTMDARAETLDVLGFESDAEGREDEGADIEALEVEEERGALVVEVAPEAVFEEVEEDNGVLAEEVPLGVGGLRTEVVGDSFADLLLIGAGVALAVLLDVLDAFFKVDVADVLLVVAPLEVDLETVGGAGFAAPGPKVPDFRTCHTRQSNCYRATEYRRRTFFTAVAAVSAVFRTVLEAPLEAAADFGSPLPCVGVALLVPAG